MSGVDRAALIDAAAQEIHDELYGRGHRYGKWERAAAVRALGHVLPLIAEAIEQLRVPVFDPHVTGVRLSAGAVGNGYLDEAAALVRSFGQDGE